MKLLFFSDLHAHQFKEFSTINSAGINSRLQSCLDIIDQITSYSLSNNIHGVVFCGDLFHTRPSVDTLTYNLTINKLIELSKVSNLYILPGNHDCYSKDDKYHSIEILNYFPSIHVLSNNDVNVLDIDKVRLIGIKYVEDIKSTEKLIKNALQHKAAHKNILLLHSIIKNSSTPSGHVFEEGLSSKWLSKNFDYTFCGHVHKYCKFEDHVYNIGSPIQHDWGDKYSKKGFLVLDTETSEVERVFTKYPEFREIDEIDISTYSGDAENFYRIKFDDDLSDTRIEKLKHEFPNSIVLYNVTSTATKRSDLTLDMNLLTMLETYVNNTETSLSKKELLAVGKMLMVE